MKKLALGALLVAVVVVAGWAGSDHGPLSAKDYRAQLNRICTNLTARYDEIGQPKTLDQVGAKGGLYVAVYEDALAAVETLRPPAELQESADRFVVVSRRIRDTLVGVVEAVKTNDLGTFVELATEFDRLDKDTDEAANQLGVLACAS